MKTQSLDPATLDTIGDLVIHEIDRWERRRTRQRRTIAVGAVGAVALLSTAGALLISMASVAQLNQTVVCYPDTDYQPDRRVSAVVDASADENALLPLDVRVRNAELRCAAGWDSNTYTQDDSQSGVIPDLTVCQNNDRSLIVFPDAGRPEEFCLTIGLHQPTS